MKVVINWEPQPKQLDCLKACGLDFPFTKRKLQPAVASIIGYGGSAGGGKTDAMVVAGLVASIVYPGINIGCFRRKFPQLMGLGGMIERSKQIYPRQIATYNQGKHRWNFKNKSSIMYCHCQNPDDVQNYQSQQFDIVMMDETTQFLEAQVKFLLTRNRATVDYKTFTPFGFFATNPGGVGHSYFKREFVDIGEPEKLHTYINETGQKESHYFIPAKVYDNKILLDRDPGYPLRLSSSEKIRRMLLEGDWEISFGAEYSEFQRSKHVMKIVVPKANLSRCVGVDWGYSGRDQDKGAFAALAMVVIKMSSQNSKGENVYFNRVIVFKEFYGKYKSPEQWAEIIFNDMRNDKMKEMTVDSSMFNPANDGSIAIIDRMRNKWEALNGDKFWVESKRGTRNRINRVACLHDWLRDAPDGMPYIMFTENCTHTIRTIPMMMTDENNERDIDTNLEDHLTDSLTYQLVNIRFIDIDVGTVGSRERRWEMVADVDSKGKQKALDLDMFMTEARKKRDWRV